MDKPYIIEYCNKGEVYKKHIKATRKVLKRLEMMAPTRDVAVMRFRRMEEFKSARIINIIEPPKEKKVKSNGTDES